MCQFFAYYQDSCVLFLSRLKGMHDTLIAVSSRTRQSFKSLQDEGKLHCRVRAADVRHLLLLLPFMVHDLFSSEVK